MLNHSHRLFSAAKRLSILGGFAFAIGICMPAEQVSAQPNTSNTTLITLGTQAGPLPNRFRSQSASLIIAGGQPYLIDAGNGAIRQLALAGIPPLKIRQIFITHHHDDHNADLGTLLGVGWSMGISTPVTVYGPDGTGEFIAGFEKSFAINAGIRTLDNPKFYKLTPHQFFQYKEIGPAKTAKLVYQDSNIQVDAIENCHFHHPGLKTESYAYRFKTADKTIVLSGDTGPCPQLVEFAKGADILVHEVINLDLMGANLTASGMVSAEGIQSLMRHMEEDHTTPEQVGELATKAGVGMVVLTHLAPGGGSDKSAYSDGVSRRYSGKVVVADDLMRF